MRPFCERSLPLLALEGVRLLEQGEFFAAHEALEAAWRQEPDAGRELYQGLLQAAVVYLHLQRGNVLGAQKVYQRARRHLLPWAPRCQGVEVGRLLEHLEETLRSWPWLDPSPSALCPPQLLSAADRRRTLCDRCGHEMRPQNCKLICPNCGYRFDCSDLTLYP